MTMDGINELTTSLFSLCSVFLVQTSTLASSLSLVC